MSSAFLFDNRTFYDPAYTMPISQRQKPPHKLIIFSTLKYKEILFVLCSQFTFIIVALRYLDNC